MNTYLTIYEKKEKVEIITNIKANENIDKDKLNATIKKNFKTYKKEQKE